MKQVDFKIEKGIPLVKKNVTRQPLSYPFEQMKKGDSFFIPVDKTVCLDEKTYKLVVIRAQQLVVSAAKRYAERHKGFKITSRTLPKGVRIWRV